MSAAPPPAAPLAGRTAIVTGASRGIGRATALALAGAGARVALLARTADALSRVAAEIDASAGTRGAPEAATVLLPCDLADAPSVERAVARALDLLGGAPDVLVNNAGSFVIAPIERLSVEEFRETLDTNLVAPFLLVRALVPPMRARGSGTIVTVGSIADRATFPENGAYAASKYGLRAMHEVVRAELRGSGVRATLVSPGPVDTPLWDAIDPDAREGFTPRAAMLSAAAVADAILYVVTRPPEVNVDELRLTRS